MADDIWCKYAPDIPEPWLCRRTFKRAIADAKDQEEKVLSLRARTD